MPRHKKVQPQETLEKTGPLDVDGFRNQLANQVAVAQRRVEEAQESVRSIEAKLAAVNRDLEAGRASAKEELETAVAEATRIQGQYNDFNTTFPADKSAQKGARGNLKSITGGKNGAAATKAAAAPTKIAASPTPKVNKAGKVGRLVIARIRKSSDSELTVPEIVAKAMGRQVWSGGDLLEELSRQGVALNASDPRGYLGTILSSSLMSVLDGNGNVLKTADGKNVKVHRFSTKKRGEYNESTDEDVQEEVRKILGASQVVMSNASPVEKVLESQDIDLLSAHH